MTAHRTRPTTRRGALLALASLGAFSLAACSTGGDAEFEESGGNEAGDGGSDSGSDGMEQPAASDDGGEEDSAGGADDAQAASSVDPSDAIDTLSYALPDGDVEGTMTVGLHHLRRRGETLELLLTFTPEFTEPGAFTLFDLHGDNHSVVAPALVDRANLTRYDILNTSKSYDSPAMWNSTQNVIELASGDTQAYWATFAAPIDEISAIDVVMGAGPSFEDVQIEAEEG
ncbi:hypothetical protein [Brachybacterium paraconglomeratum]|uniref:hypothetical protein n=1 Tax=Brachybacterium paraconglomeratum TaxID=173362 RepID=UPI0022E7FF19|nr:hypothetical protein [Brachybacterium paraconglomeratum]